MFRKITALGLYMTQPRLDSFAPRQCRAVAAVGLLGPGRV